MSQYGIYIVLIDGLRSGFALAIFLPAIKGIDELYINPVNARSATCNLRKSRYEYLYILSETCIYACSQDAWIDKSLRH